MQTTATRLLKVGWIMGLLAMACQCHTAKAGWTGSMNGVG